MVMERACPYCDVVIPWNKSICANCDKLFREAVKNPRLREFMKRFCSRWIVEKYVIPEEQKDTQAKNKGA